MDNSMSERICLFKKAKEVCMKKINIEVFEKMSFLRILKELQFRFPRVEGACEILYDFYHGSEYDEAEITAALAMIEEA